MTLEWDKDYEADGYIIKRKVGNKFIEIVRICNTDIRSIFISGIKRNEEICFMINYYKNINNEFVVYHNEKFYCYFNGRKSIKYRLPCPILKSARRVGDAIDVCWEKVVEGVTYLVIRKVVGGNWERIVTTKNTNYTDRDIDITKKYRYSVRCVSEDGETKLSGCSLKGISI